VSSIRDCRSLAPDAIAACCCGAVECFLRRKPVDQRQETACQGCLLPTGSPSGSPRLSDSPPAPRQLRSCQQSEDDLPFSNREYEPRSFDPLDPKKAAWDPENDTRPVQSPSSNQAAIRACLRRSIPSRMMLLARDLLLTRGRRREVRSRLKPGRFHQSLVRGALSTPASALSWSDRLFQSTSNWGRNSSLPGHRALPRRAFLDRSKIASLQIPRLVRTTSSRSFAWFVPMIKPGPKWTLND
jgi:hypothetical protein